MIGRGTHSQGAPKNLGTLVFGQGIWQLPRAKFSLSVARYGGELEVKSFVRLDLYLYIAFAQPTQRGRLRNIEACLRK